MTVVKAGGVAVVRCWLAPSALAGLQGYRRRVQQVREEQEAPRMDAGGANYLEVVEAHGGSQFESVARSVHDTISETCSCSRYWARGVVFCMFDISDVSWGVSWRRRTILAVHMFEHRDRRHTAPIPQ
jgi:hypothetical protein